MMVAPENSNQQTRGLSVSQLTLSAGSLALVEEVSLAVSPGKVLGIVGESGSGKSLTVMTAAGLIPPGITVTSGAVQLDDAAIIYDGKALERSRCARDIGIIFQDPFTALNPVKKAGSILIKVLMQQHGYSASDAHARTIEAFDAVGIPSPAQKVEAYPHELSGGQRQRVVIALALLGNPKLIVADEPTTALDPSVQKQILDLIREVKGEAATLFVTHDFGAAAYLCDEIAVMYAGRVVEHGPIGQILLSPRHPYTQALIACAPALEARPLVTVPGHPLSAADRPKGCAFGPRCARKTLVCDAQPALEGSDPGHSAACFHPLQNGAAA